MNRDKIFDVNEKEKIQNEYDKIQNKGLCR